MSGYLVDNPAAPWVINGVAALLQTDAVEGMASGASHDGIGNSNAATQVLANRTAALRQQQQTDIANIAALQAQQGIDVSNIATLLTFVARFAVVEGNPGYAKIPMQSGQTLMLQCGQQNTTGNATVVSFADEFSTVCAGAWAVEGGGGGWSLNPPFPTLYASTGLTRTGFTVLGLIWAGNATPGWVGIGSGRTFNWLAVGW